MAIYTTLQVTKGHGNTTMAIYTTLQVTKGHGNTVTKDGKTIICDDSQKVAIPPRKIKINPALDFDPEELAKARAWSDKVRNDLSK